MQTEQLRDELAYLYMELRAANSREEWQDIQREIHQLEEELKAAEAEERDELE